MNRPDYICCISRPTADHRVTWCGRYLVAVGFVFESIDHAAENGAQQGRLVACPECVQAVSKALTGEVPA